MSVTVTCVRRPAAAVDDTATVAEDSAATTIDVLANDIDADAVGMTIDFGDPTGQRHGGRSPAAVTDLTYQPDAELLQRPRPAATPDTFTYTLTPGGSTATVSVTVTCVDDPPTAVDDTATVVEDDPATTIDVLANDTDSTAARSRSTTVTQPANGTVVDHRRR